MLAQHLQKQLNKWGDLGFWRKASSKPDHQHQLHEPWALEKGDYNTSNSSTIWMIPLFLKQKRCTKQA